MPSRATRMPSARSRASLRGALVAQLPADQHPRKLVFESKLEERVLFLLLAHPDVVDIWDQPPAIIYCAANGRERRHVFDYLVTFASGHRAALAVKPFAVAERRQFREELQLIRTATPPTYARDVILVTDRSFKPEDARNAQKLHEFRRSPDDAADAAVMALIDALSGATTIAELVTQSGLQGRGFRAVFRAIYAGALRTLDAGDILPGTRVAPEGIR